jgi:uncharacterized protein
MSGKLEKLEAILGGFPDLAVAYSGGMDSTLLLYLARKTVPGRVVAFTAVSDLLPRGAAERAAARAAQLGVPHVPLELDLLDDPDVASNPVQRCYHCKKAILTRIGEEAARRGLSTLVDATHVDDRAEFRPGLLALLELNVRSPLAEAGFTKEEVRHYLAIFNLPGAGEPSSPCLATRIPYHSPLSPERLRRVEKAEAALAELGFPVVRVRDFFPVALLEVPEGEIPRLAEFPLREKITARLREAGYPYAAADLRGYRSGSLLEAVQEQEKEQP